jgi:hypothetical protein
MGHMSGGTRTSSKRTGSDNDGPSIDRLRADFPQFRIWREYTGDRVRYIARRLAPGAGPHTVVTADSDELRTILGDGTGQPPAQATDPSR